MATKGGYGKTCYVEVQKLLDRELPQWRDDQEAQAMQKAEEIVEWTKANGKLPSNGSKDKTEKKLGAKITGWRSNLKGKGGTKCYDKIKDYLDRELSGWSNDHEIHALEQGKELVEWVRNNNGKMPSNGSNDMIEKKHGIILSCWRQDVRGKRGCKCYDKLKHYLDQKLPGWNDQRNLIIYALEQSKELVEWVRNHDNNMPSQKSKDPVEKQLGSKLSYWKKASKEVCRKRCYDEVKNYLDRELPQWRDERQERAMNNAKELTVWIKSNNKMPNKRAKDDNEKRLGMIVCRWRGILTGSIKQKLHTNVLNYLDANLPGWRGKNIESQEHDIITKSSTDLPPESSRQAEERAVKEMSIEDEVTTESSSESSSESIDTLNSVKSVSDSNLIEDCASSSCIKQSNKSKCNHKWVYTEHKGDYVVKTCELCERQSTVNRCSSSNGYSEPNPDKKREINEWFKSGYSEYIQGKAVILDNKGMKSTHALLKSGKFGVEDIIVPEYCDDTYEDNMINHKELSSCLRSGDYLEVLKKEVIPEEMSVLYADFTGTFDTWVKPLIEHLKKVYELVRSGTVIGVTWSENGNKDKESIQCLWEYMGVFKHCHGWRELEKSPKELGYGVGGNMNVLFYVKK